MTLPIYVYENGEITWDILNNVSMFFATKSFTEMIAMVGMIAFFLTVVTFAVKPDPNTILKYLLIYLLVPLFCYKIRTDVEVVNLGDPGWTKGTVQNVPMVIAYPAYLTSSIGYGVTSAVEDIFHTDDNASYTKTGMIYASRVQRATQDVKINDPHLKELWSQYIRNCIRPDILINGKYTWTEFANSPDIFDFLTNHSPSPLRRIVDRSSGKVNYPTCKEALPQIKTAFDAEANKGVSFIGTALGFLTENKAKKAALLQSQIEANNANFTGMSGTSKSTLVQNMAINGIRTGLMDSAANSNATAAQLNYANTKMDLQNMNMWTSLGIRAQTYIPELHSLLFLMILVAPIFVVCLAMIPNMTFLVLKNYVFGYIYLASWPPLFVIINYFMTKTLEMESIDLTKGAKGLTFSNYHAVYHEHIYFAGMCGWLLSTVPFIAPYIVKGGASIMSSLSMQVAGMINSSAGQAASENTTGNYSLGNTSMDNHNANKIDTRFMQQTHGMLTQNHDGTAITRFDGSNVYSAGGSISQTPFQIHGQQAMSQALSHSYNQADKLTQSAAANYTHSQQALTNDIAGLSSLTSHNQNYGSSTSNGVSATQSKALNQMQSAVQEYAHSHNVSTDSAWKAMVEGYGDDNGSIGVKLFGTGEQTKIGVRGSINKNWGGNDTDSDSNRHSDSNQKQFNDALNTLNQSAMNDTTGDQHSKLSQAMHNINHDAQEVTSSAQQYSTAKAHEEALATQLQRVNSGQLQVSDNLVPQFQSWLEDNPHAKAHVQQLMTGSNPSIAAEREGYLQQFMQEKIDSGDMSIFKEAMPSNTDFNANAAQQVANSHEHFNQSESVAAQQGRSTSNYFDGHAYEGLKHQAQDNINQRNDTLAHTTIPTHHESSNNGITKFSELDKPTHEGADWRTFEGKPDMHNMPKDLSLNKLKEELPKLDK